MNIINDKYEKIAQKTNEIVEEKNKIDEKLQKYDSKLLTVITFDLDYTGEE